MYIYIDELPCSIQNSIINDLTALGLSNEDIQLAMQSKIHDLADTINIKVYLLSKLLLSKIHKI